jgi:hypothetical protein
LKKYFFVNTSIFAPPLYVESEIGGHGEERWGYERIASTGRRLKAGKIVKKIISRRKTLKKKLIKTSIIVCLEPHGSSKLVHYMIGIVSRDEYFFEVL